MVLLFSANKGTSFGLLKKVASGGEMSRIMLAIKAILANYSKHGKESKVYLYKFYFFGHQYQTEILKNNNFDSIGFKTNLIILNIII